MEYFAVLKRATKKIKDMEKCLYCSVKKKKTLQKNVCLTFEKKSHTYKD